MTTKKERKAALAAMTKAELVKTITQLDARQTKLLNEISMKDKLFTEMQFRLSALQLDYDKVMATRAVRDASEEAGLLDHGTVQEARAAAGDTQNTSPTKFPWET